METTEPWPIFFMLIIILHCVIRHPRPCFNPPDPKIGYQGAHFSPTPFGSYYPAGGLSFASFPAATVPTAPVELANVGPFPTATVPPTAEVQSGFSANVGPSPSATVPLTTEVQTGLSAPKVNTDPSVAVDLGSPPVLEKHECDSVSDLIWISQRHVKMAIPVNTSSHSIGFGGRY